MDNSIAADDECRVKLRIYGGLTQEVGWQLQMAEATGCREELWLFGNQRGRTRVGLMRPWCRCDLNSRDLHNHACPAGFVMGGLRAAGRHLTDAVAGR